MKQIIFLLILIPLCGFSQKTFAPLGAVWNYEQASEWNSLLLGCQGYHLQYRVEEAVVIEEKDCSIIRSYLSNNIDTLFKPTGDSLIVWEDGKQIYFQQDSLFLLLFDFGAELGDTIVRYDPFKRGEFSGTYYPDSSTIAHKMEMYISDISFTDIEGINTEVKTMTPIDTDLDYRSDRILAGIGSLSQSFTGHSFYYLANGCDNGGLVCYNNEELEYKTSNSFGHPGCDNISSVDSVDDELQLNLNIFPNPFRSKISIETDLDQFTLKVIDLNGSVLITGSNQYQLNTESLSTGVYILQIATRTGIRNKVVVKQ